MGYPREIKLGLHKMEFDASSLDLQIKKSDFSDL